MPAVRIGPKHQVTIPKEVFDNLALSVGDFLNATAHGGRILLTPLQLSEKVPAPRLTPTEQRRLARAKVKIERIRHDPIHSKGLTTQEAHLAAKAGLIDSDQMYWWTEAWQKEERAAVADVRAGRVLGPFATVEGFKQDLKKRRGIR